MAECCETCRFFFAADTGHARVALRVNACRRFPPPTSAAFFPAVHPTDWCGEYRRVSDDHMLILPGDTVDPAVSVGSTS